MDRIGEGQGLHGLFYHFSVTLPSKVPERRKRKRKEKEKVWAGSGLINRPQ